MTYSTTRALSMMSYQTTGSLFAGSGPTPAACTCACAYACACACTCTCSLGTAHVYIVVGAPAALPPSGLECEVSLTGHVAPPQVSGSA